MKYYRFNLRISYADYQQKYYGKGYQQMLVRADNGMRLAIPAGRFIPFITRSGLHGQFILTTDDENKFVALEQVHADTGHNHS